MANKSQSVVRYNPQRKQRFAYFIFLAECFLIKIIRNFEIIVFFKHFSGKYFIIIALNKIIFQYSWRLISHFYGISHITN